MNLAVGCSNESVWPGRWRRDDSQAGCQPPAVVVVLVQLRTVDRAAAGGCVPAWRAIDRVCCKTATAADIPSRDAARSIAQLRLAVFRVPAVFCAAGGKGGNKKKNDNVKYLGYIRSVLLENQNLC